MHKVLLLEDDLVLSNAIKEFLKEESFSVIIASKLDEIKNTDVDLMILDWRLPDGRGIDFLKKIRAEGVKIPVIMLTSRSDLEDKIIGLELGANDYMTKPFEPKELLARMNAQLRVFFKNDSNIELRRGDLTINTDERSVFFKNKSINLTKLEFDLLYFLASNINKAFAREEILNKIWGFDSFPTTRTVDMHIKQLRQKLRDQYFVTVHGIGYKFVQP